MQTLSNFKDWTQENVQTTFGLQRIFGNFAPLDEWLQQSAMVDDIENKMLLHFQKGLNRGVEGWNEFELENKFISPLFVMAGFDSDTFSYFLERDMAFEWQGQRIQGRVDGMIASGYLSPRKPYFCLAEYKRQTDPDGDPAGQCLIAMLAAQYLNDNPEQVIYGAYIIGATWRFTALKGNEYAVSKTYTADDEEIFEVFKILKALKNKIETWII